MRSLTRSFATVVLMALAARGSGAQVVTEIPIPFDGAGKVRTLTPSLVSRFGLQSPAWPVQGAFVEARLFAVSTGGRVLAVQRQSGAIDRYGFTDSAAATVRAAIETTMAQSGRLVTEERADVISEPARGAFVRNQMGLTWALYGPLAAAATNDVKAGTALYLMGTGASYFITTAIGKRTTVTRAQNNLATDGALRGAGTAAGLMYAFSPTDHVHGRTVSGVALAGSIAGTVAGFKFGSGRTDSEAQATTTISNIAALTALGIGGAMGAFEDSIQAHGTVGAVVGASLLGYALGPSYPRRASYAVTRGDVQMLSVTSLLGVAVALTPFVGEDVDPKGVFVAATAGMLGGALVGDRVLARRFDYSTSEATQVGLGLAAGALLGAGVIVLTESSDSRGAMGTLTAGAILGTIAGHKMANPARAGVLRTGAARTPGAQLGSTKLELNPTGLVFGLARVPGQHGIVSLRF